MDNSCERYGLHELCSHENPTVDIIAVHGLNGHPFDTWCIGGKNINWLQDKTLLPRSLKSARILTWGYNANITALLGSTSSDRILQHAQTLVAQLEAQRSLDDIEKRPIIFICHSLGGIIVKRALAYSASRTSANIKHLHSVFVSTYGILFLGTPHNGSDKAKLFGTCQRMVKTILPKRVFDTDSQLLNALQAGSETLQNITDQFAPLMKQFHIFFFWEQEKTDLGYSRDYIVDESSAAPILDNTERSGIAASHSEMCKFSSKSSPGYTVVVAALRRYERDAPARIEKRWREAVQRLQKTREEEAWELIES